MNDVVYIVERHEHSSASYNESAWWTPEAALREAERIAKKDAETLAAHPAFQNLSQVRAVWAAGRWQVEKSGYNGDDWQTLRSFTVQRLEVQGSAVDRLAELVR